MVGQGSQTCNHGGPWPHAMSHSDGSALVAWPCGGAPGACVSHVLHVGATGTPALLEAEGGAMWFAASFDGLTHVFVWGTEEEGSLRDLRGVQVTRQGEIVGDPAGFPIAPAGARALGLSAAFDGENHVIVWLDATAGAPALRAARINLAGEVLDPEPAIVAELPPDCDALALGARAAAHDGTATLVAFRGCGAAGSDVFGVELDGDLVAQPVFAITDDAAPDEVPALASSGAGVTMATYTSFRDAAPLAARRVMARLLTRDDTE